MKRQNLNNGKFLLSFRKEEMKESAIVKLLKHLNSLPPGICRQSGNQYNYIIESKALSLTDNADYGPFTREEWIEGEVQFAQFMSQFDDILI